MTHNNTDIYTPETTRTRDGITFMQAARMFATEAKAEEWFIQKRWGGRANITCPKCGERSVCEIKSRNPMPFQCTKPECRKCFSVKTGSVMQSSKLPLSHWAIAHYLITTNLKGTSSCKLARELGITQKSAWHMLHRIRQSWDDNADRFRGPVEVDEMYHGGVVKNRLISKRERIGGGPKDKAVVLGMKDRFSNRIRAMQVADNHGTTIRPIVMAHTEPNAKVYTDESHVYHGLGRVRESVNHSGQEYVRGDVHTNGIESLWAMFKRGLMGVYHSVSIKHLDRYLCEFTGRRETRPLDTDDQLTILVQTGVGKLLPYAKLIEPRQLPRPTQITD